MQTLRRVGGSSSEGVVSSLADIAPDLGKFVVESAAGDILSRPGLDLRTRQIATVAALTALGTADPQLKVQINGALNDGCTEQEIIEVIMQMTVWGGFQAALNGIEAAREVFAKRRTRRPFGQAALVVLQILSTR